MHMRKFINTCVNVEQKIIKRMLCQDTKVGLIEPAPVTKVVSIPLMVPMEKLDPRVKSSIPLGELGQPTCHTHPHLVPTGDLTYGMTQEEYIERRHTLCRKLLTEVPLQSTNIVIIIPAACKQYMTDKIPFVFRQNSDFYYLTGCLEPSAVLLMTKTPQESNFKSVLFVHEKDSHAELWEGPRTGCTASRQLFGVTESRPIENFQNYLKKVTAVKNTNIWYNKTSTANPELHRDIISVARDSLVAWNDPTHHLHMMRVIKSPAEVALMRETCLIGAQAINTAMGYTKPGISEHAVNALLDYTCRQAGAEHLAFPPVVAGGARATHIHYVTNNQMLQRDEMLLVDSGTQKWLYNSDISRTWPVSGKFSPYHKILYEIVLTVQKRLISILAEHRPSLDQLFDQMCRLLGTHLQQEGILPAQISSQQLVGKAYRLCPHHVSHYLGLDVHDASMVRRHSPVVPNMVVTVEPGIYVMPNDTTVREEFRGVGIRVEDDVLITESGADVLTSTCVKEIEDIESLVGKHQL